MPARAAASASGANACSSTIETAIPSAFFEIAERSARSVSDAEPRGEPVHCISHLTSAAASCAPNCVATSSGSSVSWLTKTNRQRGCAG